MAKTTPDRRPALILASSSRYRRALLSRLQVDFSCRSPAIPEERLVDEEPAGMATRLARSKAAVVAQSAPHAVVIGSDQVAVRGDEILSKPGTEARAVAQLGACSGAAVEFLTAVCVIDGSRQAAEPFLHVDVTRVQFRQLDAQEIQRYVRRERPLDCAGGFRCEGLGIALFDRIDSRDPTALIGLPLIWLSAVLRQIGFEVI
jgi:septum formation protein